MVSYSSEPFSNVSLSTVLILVVVDNGLVRTSLMISTSMGINVLILVVVDNGLILLCRNKLWKDRNIVLILVVVDNGLVRSSIMTCAIWSVSLNPCCSGQWSRTWWSRNRCRLCKVLILVVVDNGLVLDAGHCKTLQWPRVLILVVVDNGLVHCAVCFRHRSWWCLNPCCSGQWSRTHRWSWYGWCFGVLILVVVDNGLVLLNHLNDIGVWRRLNPCCSGQWSRTPITL